MMVARFGVAQTMLANRKRQCLAALPTERKGLKFAPSGPTKQAETRASNEMCADKFQAVESLSTDPTVLRPTF